MEHAATGTSRPDEVETENTGVAEPPVFRPWIRLLIGFALSLAGVLGVFVFTSLYLESRPLDLRGEAGQLHAVLRHILTEAGVPAEDIEESEVEHYAGNGVFWCHAEFDVAVPDHLDADGLGRAVIRNMTLRNVAVLPEDTETDGVQAFRLAYGGRHIAELRFHESSPEDPAYARLAAELAETLVELLDTSDIPLASLELLGPKPARAQTEECERRRVVAELGERADWDGLESLLDELELAGGSNAFEREALTEPLHDYYRALVWQADGCPWLELHLLPSREMAESEGLERPVLPFLEVPEEERDERESVLEAEALPLCSEKHPDPAEPRAEVPDERRRISIIVDDGGYGGEGTEQILALEAPLTLAILPYTPAGSEIAKRGREQGFEIMLHMPMEAGDEDVTYPGELRTDMEPEEIVTLTEKALADISGADGVNNHTGSAFTEDAEAMTAFLEVLRESDLYFVDSVTSPNSIAYDKAVELGVSAIRRNIFLDHDRDPEAIRNEFEALINYSKKHGTAVGIGHFQSAFADIIGELLPRLEEEDIELVPVSELVSS